MTEIAAAIVKELREKSGAGFMDCKKALNECAGDMERALDYLRKQGAAKADKKADRATQEGLLALAVSGNGQAVALVDVNCETDFVARTDQFQGFIKALAQIAVEAGTKDLETLLKQKTGAVSVEASVAELIAKLGENIKIKRVCQWTAQPGQSLGAYLHAGDKIGALVRLSVPGQESAARDVAMHLSAMAPRFIRPESVPQDVLNREKDIIRDTPDLKGKPEMIAEKILEGKIRRFYADQCLTEQIFIKDVSGKQTVSQFLKTAAGQAAIVDAVRFQVGEESVA